MINTQPQYLDPTTLYDRLSRQTQPEIRLVANVVLRAIADLCVPAPLRRKDHYANRKAFLMAKSTLSDLKDYRRSAQRWVSSPVDDVEPFTFGWCCRVLNLSSDEIREIQGFARRPPRRINLRIGV